MAGVHYDFDHINRPIYVWQEKIQGPFHMLTNHYHDAYEIYYLLEGERYYFIKDRTYHVKAGDLVLINLGELHKTIDAGIPSYERILINFKKDFLDKYITTADDLDLLSCFRQKTSVLRFNLIEQANIQQILSKIVFENKKNNRGSNTYMKLLLSELLVLSCRQFDKMKEDDLEHPGPMYKKISDIVSYINTHYMENITLNFLSSHNFISQYHLSRTFKEVTGFNFVEYVNSVRAKEARSLLSKTRLSVTQIAEKVGFESVTHFERVFKSITGLSPLKYRKEILSAIK